MPPTDMTQEMVLAAVQDYERGGEHLSTSGFAVVVNQRFDRDGGPTQEWARGVLGGLPYLERIEERPGIPTDLWRYLPGPIGNAWDCHEGHLVKLAG